MEVGRPRAGTEIEWGLYLDESGQFDQRDEAVCIVGMLLQEPPSGEADDILRGVYRRIDPIAWYPPHATDLRLPAWWVAAWVLASPEARAAHPAARTIEHAAALCAQARAAPDLSEMFELLDQQRRPKHGALARATRWLDRHHRPTADALRELARDVERRYQDVAGELLRRFGPDRCFAVAASDDGLSAPSPADQSDRYLALLVPLFERVFALLRARPAERHTVRLFAAERHVFDPVLGSRRLRPQDLDACVRLAERFPLDAPATPTDPWVRLVSTMTMPYDEFAPPGVVLADFVANRARLPLAGNAPWSDLHRVLTADTRLPFEAAARSCPTLGPRPTIAANGPARHTIAQAFGHDGDTSPPDTPPGWRSDQAQRWCEVAAMLGAGGVR